MNVLQGRPKSQWHFQFSPGQTYFGIRLQGQVQLSHWVMFNNSMFRVDPKIFDLHRGFFKSQFLCFDFLLGQAKFLFFYRVDKFWIFFTGSINLVIFFIGVFTVLSLTGSLTQGVQSKPITLRMILRCNIILVTLSNFYVSILW